MPSDLTIAWLAQGKIRLKQGTAPARTIESRFGQTIRERAVQAQQRHSWKTQGNEDSALLRRADKAVDFVSRKDRASPVRGGAEP